MKKLSLTEVKRRIRNHEALPDDVVKWYPKLMSRYTIRKVKRNPRGFTGKESRPRLKRYGRGEYRRSARSKELYPRVFVKNPKFSAAQRRKYAESGIALPDGSFPIRNRKDLMDALHDLGRTKHYAAAKRHIIKRARALGLTADLNPEWVRRKGKKRNPKRYRRMRNGDLVLAR